MDGPLPPLRQERLEPLPPSYQAPPNPRPTSASGGSTRSSARINSCNTDPQTAHDGVPAIKPVLSPSTETTPARRTSQSPFRERTRPKSVGRTRRPSAGGGLSLAELEAASRAQSASPSHIEEVSSDDDGSHYDMINDDHTLASVELDTAKSVVGGSGSHAIDMLPEPASPDDYIFVSQHGTLHKVVYDANTKWTIARHDERGYLDLDVNIETPVALPASVRKVARRVVNRYNDILPNPRTRVHLHQVSNDPISGYINANYVRGPDGNPRAYICAMGPLPGTVDAFWRMLWSKKPSVIVMLTRLRESGREKCARYWPQGLNLDPVEYSPGIRVVATDAVVSSSGFVRTTLCVTKGKVSIKIEHFQFTTWPDHGVPDTTRDCLALEAAVHCHLACQVQHHATPAPIVVHCSAGVGRSGTFIALEHCMHELALTRFTDPLHVIRTVRQDRSALVQNPLQYAFLHECVVAFAKSKCAGELVVETTESRHSAVLVPTTVSDDGYDSLTTKRRSHSYIEAVRKCKRAQATIVPKKRSPRSKMAGCSCVVV
eukprot:m.50351 g.50351  ORF g.50351 m.50351 type:complete len:545 (-) comp16314_c0_seq2:139-1773(-)